MLCGAPLCKAQVLAGLITQTGPQGGLLMRAPQRWEPLSAWLCAPPLPAQGGLAPGQLSLEGRAGSELHMGKLLQKTQQCFWTMSSSHRLWRRPGVGLVGSWALRES